MEKFILFVLGLIIACPIVYIIYVIGKNINELEDDIESLKHRIFELEDDIKLLKQRIFELEDELEKLKKYD